MHMDMDMHMCMSMHMCMCMCMCMDMDMDMHMCMHVVTCRAAAQVDDELGDALGLHDLEGLLRVRGRARV